MSDLTGITIPAVAAFNNALRSENSRWDEARFSQHPLYIAHTPKFTLEPRSSFFCIGSCFARNIEDALICRDVPVLSKRIVSPRAESAKRPNRIVNKFTTLSIANELRWSLVDAGGSLSSIVETADGFVDLQLVPDAPSVTYERAVERRRYLGADYYARIRDANVLIITLGLIETWRDNKTGVWQNAPPPYFAVKRDPERFSLVLTSVEQNVEALEAVRSIARLASPDLKIVVTVSPVPLQTTFSGEDVFEANMRSKSVLRAAAWQFAAAHADVEYFPSYEMVMGSNRADTFAPDQVHVRSSFVEKIVDRFARVYIPGAADPPPNFRETLYLRANPDVLDLLATGAISSGYEHWRKWGQSEARPLAPDPIPEEMYRSGQVDRPIAEG